MFGCRYCTAFAKSGNGSRVVTNCSCEVGYDNGDGETRAIYTEADRCSVTMEVRIVTVEANAMNCWSNSSPPAEYCDVNAGTQKDVWLRVQWAVGIQTPLRFNVFGIKIDSGYALSRVILPYSTTAEYTQERRIPKSASNLLLAQQQGQADPWSPPSPISADWWMPLSNQMPTTILACNVTFPKQANLGAGLLWQFAAESAGANSKAWFGIKKCTPSQNGCYNQSFFYLRVRAGEGTTSIDPVVDVAVSSVKDHLGRQVWIDTTDFPRDGLQHQVVVHLCDSPLRVRLWIDGADKGTHAMPPHLDKNQSQWVSSGVGQAGAKATYGQQAPGAAVGGEPTVSWPGGSGALASHLRMFVRTDWEGCSGAVLDGDWVSGGLDGLSIYCPPTSAVGADVWSNWYALYQDAGQDYELPVEPGRGFDFASGKSTVALLTGIPGNAFGMPIGIEYYVSGADAWRPASLQVRFPSGVARYGLSDVPFTTRGELCWVDSDGQQFEQTALGCPIVGQSAKATLLEKDVWPTATGAVGVGLYSSPTTPDSVYALLANDQTSRPGARTAQTRRGVTRYLLESDGDAQESIHHGGHLSTLDTLDMDTNTGNFVYDLDMDINAGRIVHDIEASGEHR